eukprot:TRINITY_DN12616_c0_g1_i1.p1 TRINITY_DN12616_c0_g1~~TRINITY_DN12616_c0_g1_i1.p1  ORF type:complete len:135 (-),score=9.69 TRINITY_DN12616_c0_g1_i1:89-493(-)
MESYTNPDVQFDELFGGLEPSLLEDNQNSNEEDYVGPSSQEKSQTHKRARHEDDDDSDEEADSSPEVTYPVAKEYKGELELWIHAVFIHSTSSRKKTFIGLSKRFCYLLYLEAHNSGRFGDSPDKLGPMVYLLI